MRAVAGLVAAATFGSGGSTQNVGALLPAPVVTGITGPAVVDPAGGGNALLIDGTGFVSGCTCTIGGVAGTVTFVSSTRINVVPGAHASGVVHVVVTNPDTQTSGTSGNNRVEYFKPHDLGPTCELLPGAYSAATGIWTDASGLGNHATYASATKPAAFNVNGVGTACPDFDGVDQYLNIAQSLASYGGSPPDMATLTAGTKIVGFQADTTQPDPGVDYADSILSVGNGASCGACINDDGFLAETYDEATALYDRTAVQAAANGTKHIGFVRWSTTTWGGRVNGNAFATVTLTHGGLSDGNVGAATELGRSFVGTQYYDGKLLFYFVFATAISDANCNKIRSWAQQRGYVA